jgi:hypothetical protein
MLEILESQYLKEKKPLKKENKKDKDEVEEEEMNADSTQPAKKLSQ